MREVEVFQKTETEDHRLKKLSSRVRFEALSEPRSSARFLAEAETEVPKPEAGRSEMGVSFFFQSRSETEIGKWARTSASRNLLETSL